MTSSWPDGVWYFTACHVNPKYGANPGAIQGLCLESTPGRAELDTAIAFANRAASDHPAMMSRADADLTPNRFLYY